MFCLIVGIGAAAYFFENILNIGGSKFLWRWKLLEKWWGNFVYSLIGALRREDYCNQKLVGCAIVELRFCYRHGFLKVGYYLTEELFSGHCIFAPKVAAFPFMGE